MKRATIAVVLCLALLAGASSAQDPLCPLGGYIDEETGGCAVGVSIDLAYPAWIVDSDAATAAVGAVLTAVRDEFLTAMSTPLEEFYTGGFVDASYMEYEHGAALRTIIYTVTTYTGGAHPNTYFFSVTIDTIAGREITLDGDIFVADAEDVVRVLQPLVVAQLVEQMGDFADMEWIRSGTDELADYAAWAINAGTLELFFPPYQVAPYAAGSFQASIDVDDLASVINPMLLP